MDRGKHSKGPALTARRLAEVSAVFLVLLVVHLKLREFVVDDAFIHFRIARNFANDGVPFYNVGEAVKGSSSTLWVIVLASVFAMFGSSVWVVAALNSAILTLVGYTYGSLTRQALRTTSGTAWLAGALAVVAVFPASVGLMETGLALLLVGIALLLLLQENRWGYLVAGIAVYARPEMSVFLLGALTAGLASRRFKPRRVMVPVIVGVVPFLVFDYAFYGTTIPHAAIAKSVVFPLTTFESLGMTSVASEFPLLTGAFFYFLAVLLCAALWKESRSEGATWNHVLLVTFAVSGAIVLTLYVAAGAFVFIWYQPIYVLPAVMGGLWLSVLAPVRTHIAAAAAMAIPSLAIVLAAVPSLVEEDAYAGVSHANARVDQLRAIGTALKAECPDCVLLAPEIGGLGYEFNGYLIDSVGLVTPEALDYHPTSVFGAVPVGLVEDVEPDVVVGLSIFLEAVSTAPVSDDYLVLSCPVSLPDQNGVPVVERIIGVTETKIMVSKSLQSVADSVAQVTEKIGCAYQE